MTENLQTDDAQALGHIDADFNVLLSFALLVFIALLLVLRNFVGSLSQVKVEKGEILLPDLSSIQGLEQLAKKSQVSRLHSTEQMIETQLPSTR